MRRRDIGEEREASFAAKVEDFLTNGYFCVIIILFVYERFFFRGRDPERKLKVGGFEYYGESADYIVKVQKKKKKKRNL